MKNLKKLLFAATLAIPGILVAQQSPQYTMAMFNRQVYNPAFVAEEGLINIEVGGRTQWVNLEGAPQTFVLAVEAPVGKSIGLNQTGAGLILVNDRIGYYTNNVLGLQLSHGYAVKNSVVSIGLQGTFGREVSDFTNSNSNSNVDPSLTNNTPQYTGNFGLGVKVSNAKYFAGLSMNQVLKNSYNENAAEDKLHYFGMAGMHLNRDGLFSYHPIVIAKYAGDNNTSSNLSVDGGMYVTLDQKVSLGALYRFKESVAAMLKLRISNEFSLGYAYDFGLNQLSNQFAGSHEVWLSFNLGKVNPNSVVSPRMFNYY